MTMCFHTLLTATLVGVLLVGRSPVAGHTVACSIVSYTMDLRSCFKIHYLDGVRVHERSSIANTSVYVEGFLAQPSVICQEKDRFVELLDCVSGVTSKCLPTHMAAYVSSNTLNIAGINYLCQHLNGTNTNCYTQAYKAAFDCTHRLIDQTPDDQADFATIVCAVADMTHDCIEAERHCDVTTQKLLLEFQDSYRKPAGCPDPARQREKYISTSGAESLPFCILLIIFLGSLLLPADLA